VCIQVVDWNQEEGNKFFKVKVGRKPEFTDSEVIRLMLAQDFIPYPCDTKYVECINANSIPIQTLAFTGLFLGSPQSSLPP
jgi:hypothetical protein